MTQLVAVGGVRRTLSNNSPGAAKMLTIRSVNGIGFTGSLLAGMCSSMGRILYQWWWVHAEDRKSARQKQ
jgi:hypothetical protein